MYYITLHFRGPKICRTTKHRQNRTLDIGRIREMTTLSHNFSWILCFHAFSTERSGLKPSVSSLFRPRKLQATFSSNMHNFWHRYHNFSGFKVVIWWNFSQAVICQYSFSEPKMHRCTVSWKYGHIKDLQCLKLSIYFEVTAHPDGERIRTGHLSHCASFKSHTQDS